MTEQFDVQAMLSQAQQLQQRMLDAQAAVASEAVEGSAGGGAVRITATGAGEFTRVRIDLSVVDANDVEVLEDLVLAALHDVAQQVSELSRQRLGELGLGGLGGLLGGA